MRARGNPVNSGMIEKISESNRRNNKEKRSANELRRGKIIVMA